MSLSHRFSFRLFIPFNFHLFTVSCTTGLDLLEEIISLVINQDKCREIFHFNLPDSFHTQLRIFHTLDALDIILSLDSSWTTA